MALHRAAPHAASVEVGVIGFRSDRGRIKEQFGAHQRHRARGFGIPLVPAHADADPRAKDVPDLETGIAGPEIIFFLITGAVGNVALAIQAHDRAVGADHRETVVIMRRSEEHTSELPSLMRNSYDVFCLKKKKETNPRTL